MAEYRTIRMGFWTDPYIEELDAKAKLLYIYLFTGPYTNNLGIVEVTRRKIAYETAMTVQEADKFLAQFESDGKVVCDAKRNIIFVTRFIRHQCSTSPKVMDSLKKLAPSVPSEKIAEALCILYPAVYDVSKEDGDTICIPYGDGTGTVTIPSGVLGTWKGNLEREMEVEEAGEPAMRCPHQKIIEIYHSTLPELPQIKVWKDSERAEMLKTRWRERMKAGKYSTVEEGIAYWQRLFQHIHESCDWLMGRISGNDGRAFKADLAWMVRPENFAKIIEGKYDRREAA